MPKVLCKILAFIGDTVRVEVHIHDMKLPVDMPYDVLRSKRLKKGQEFVWDMAGDEEEIKPEHIITKWTENDLGYTRKEVVRIARDLVADAKREVNERRYMVILHLGRHEDQEIPSVVLALNAPKGAEPRDILDKFVADTKKACDAEGGKMRVCYNNKCRRYDSRTDSPHCPECGSLTLQVQKDSDTKDLLRYVRAELFEASVDGFSDVLNDILVENGWDPFPREYNPDVIVTISGVTDRLLDGNAWSDDFGRLEVLRA